MKQPKIKRHKGKKFNTPDIIRNLRNINTCTKTPTAPVYKAIIEDYIKMIHVTLLRGYEWELPKNMGTLCIHKNSMEGKDQIMKELVNGQYKNLNRTGYSYTIDLSSEHLKKNGMTFKPSILLKKKLHIVLERTNMQYRVKS